MRLLILIVMLVCCAGHASAQLHRSPTAVILGNSSDTHVLYNDSNVTTGSANMTFDGTKLTVADFDILPDDGNNGIYLDDNPTAAGGYDCVTNAPATGDMILNADSDDQSGELFICLPDGVNYEVPKFDSSTLLSCPGCDWSIDSTGIMKLKNIRFHSATEDISVEFSKISLSISGSTDDDWNSSMKFNVGTSNGSTYSQAERLRIDGSGGLEIRSANSISGGPSTLKLWDLDNATGSITLAVPDVTGNEFTNTLASNNGTVLTDASPFGVTVTAAATLAPSVADITHGRFVANHSSSTDYTLPTLLAVFGMEPCFYDLLGNGIIIDAPADTTIRLPNGTVLDPADSIVSTTANAIGDFICILAITNAQWVSMANSGTWTDGGP